MTENAAQRTTEHWIRRVLAVLLVLLGIFLTVIYWLQPDRLVPITMVPAWCWLVPVLIGIAIIRNKRVFLILTVWLLFSLLHVEEIPSLARNLRIIEKQDSVNTSAIQVASLNCNVGMSRVAQEAIMTQSDICLLQESPGLDSLNKLLGAEKHDSMAIVWAGDNSIIVRGKIEPIMNDIASHFCHVLATLPDGKKVDVVSLRLSAPVFRLDFWEAGFWNDHYRKRIHHREQLAEIVNHLKQHQRTEYLIIGGDFNSVANDGALTTTLTDFSDSFGDAGAGWGGTGTNGIPVFRVDQIWASQNMNCTQSRAFKTMNSDHRMVISKFLISE